MLTLKLTEFKNLAEKIFTKLEPEIKKIISEPLKISL